MAIRGAEPLVTIAVPAYNHGNFIEQTLRSLMAQTYSNLELILVDDKSTDNTLAKAEELQAELSSRFCRMVIIASPRNSGIAVSLNTCISSAQGEFLFVIASDDLVDPHAISSLVDRATQDPGASVYCGDANMIDAAGAAWPMSHEQQTFASFVRYLLHGRTDADLHRSFGSYESFLGGNYIAIGSLVRLSALLAVGGYDEGCAMEDLDLWFKLSKSFRFAFVDRVNCHYRWHGNNTSAKRSRIINCEIGLLAREFDHCVRYGLTHKVRSRLEHLLRVSVDDPLVQCGCEHKRLRLLLQQAEEVEARGLGLYKVGRRARRFLGRFLAANRF